MFDGLKAWFYTPAGQAIVAGALGSLVRWMVVGGSFKEGVAMVVTGCICALYLGPLALPLVESTIGVVVKGGDLDGLASFLVGLGGMAIANMLIFLIEKRARQTKSGDSQ